VVLRQRNETTITINSDNARAEKYVSVVPFLEATGVDGGGDLGGENQKALCVIIFQF
jgi:hypothetical protein